MKTPFAATLSLAVILATNPATASPVLIFAAAALAAGAVERPRPNSLTRLGNTRPTTDGSAERVMTC